MKSGTVILQLALAAALPGLVLGSAAVPVPPPAAGAPGLMAAETDLARLMARQQEVLAYANRENFDEDRFTRDMQRLADDFDQFITRYPKYPPGYTAFGTLLAKLKPMRRQAAGMLLKADALYAESGNDPNQRTPAFLKAWGLTKNQLGNLVAEDGKPLVALGHFSAAIDLVPDEPIYHYSLGSLLSAARDDFLKEGSWSRADLERTMHRAFRRAADLAPGRVEFAYRFAESFYDMEHPDWDEALRVWASLEEKVTAEVDRQTMRLHAAHVLIRQQKFDRARAVLATVQAIELAANKEKLVAQLPAAEAK